jgi:hypothetical protein
MKLILGGGIAALAILELKPDYRAICSSERLGGQMSSRFNLGPRILHRTDAVEMFLDHIGIDSQKYLREFKVKYVWDGSEIDYPTADQSAFYFEKTRGQGIPFSTMMNAGKKSFYGIDMKDINLAERLYGQNQDRIIRDDIRSINVIDNTITSVVKTYKFESLISTIDFAEFLKLAGIGRPEVISSYKRNVTFTLAALTMFSEGSFDLEGCDFKYFLNDAIINRVSKIGDGSTIVIESNKPLPYSYLRCNGLIFIDEITMPTQITKELKVSNILGYQMAGRYAQYDHSVKLNTIIERFSHE